MSVITFSFFSKSRQLAAVIMSTINIQIGEKNVPQVGTFENSEETELEGNHTREIPQRNRDMGKRRTRKSRERFRRKAEETGIGW